MEYINQFIIILYHLKSDMLADNKFSLFGPVLFKTTLSIFPFVHTVIQNYPADGNSDWCICKEASGYEVQQNHPNVIWHHPTVKQNHSTVIWNHSG